MGGHENCPLVAIKTAHRWPRFLPIRNSCLVVATGLDRPQCKATTPAPETAWLNRIDSPLV